MNLEVRKYFQISDLKNVECLEKKMLDLPQVPCPVVHTFGPGTYTREVFLPAGSLIMGHHQNFENINVFIKGRMTLFETDGTRKEIRAPMTFVGKPGRKVAYIHEDTVFMNVYATDETDIEKLETYFLTRSVQSLSDRTDSNKTLLIANGYDRRDYLLFLKEFNLTESFVRSISEKQDDMTRLPYGSYKVKVSQSSIEGQGLRATADIKSGEIIAPARVSGKRTIAGRFTNHSVYPNARMVKGINSDIDLIATRDISGCLGGRDGEEITINYRDALTLNLEIEGMKCHQ